MLTTLILVTTLVTMTLISVTLWQSSTLMRRSEEVMEAWRGFCKQLKGKEELQRRDFSPLFWRYLKQHCSQEWAQRSAQQGESAVRDEVLRPRLLRLGGELAPLVCVSYVPPVSGLLPQLSAWSLVIPSLSTMLGVIGTFLGIQTGLYQADLGAYVGGEPSSAQLTGLMTGAGELFGSMSFAFVTSLGGLSAALVSTLIIASARQRRARYCAELRALQEEHLCVQSTAQSLERLVAELSALKSAQRESAAHLQARIDDLTRQRLLDSGEQQELIAELMVQIDDLLSLHMNSDQAS